MATAKVPAKFPATKVDEQADAQEQVRRLGEARAKVEALTKERSRLAGELGAVQKRLAELEAKCKAEFECSVEELPALVEQMKAEAEEALVKAEDILGIGTRESEGRVGEAP